jgi:hypothetical protein
MKFEFELHANLFKYWRPITRYVKEKHKINQADLDMLMFLYAEQYFAQKDFKSFEAAFPWDITRFRRLMKDGWIHEFRKPSHKRAALYCLTMKGKAVMLHMFRKLFGEETISETYRSLPNYNKRNNHAKVIRRGLAKKINEENRVRRQSLESPSEEPPQS